MKAKYKIYGEEYIDPAAVSQFLDAMKLDFVIRGALMPDGHYGYSLPIGAVVATQDVVVPSWVGYDIGCGMCAVQTSFDAYDVKYKAEKIYHKICELVPVGFKHQERPQLWPNAFSCSEWFSQMFKEKKGFNQLGTLGSGNHFIEIGVGEDEHVWIVIHSGSRNVGHSTATHYMKLASGTDKAKEGNYGLLVGTPEATQYLTDQKFCLEFALANRKHMVFAIETAMQYVGCVGTVYMPSLINRTHNHVEYNKKKAYWVHRKGATHAEKGMLGVIPGNMRDGSYIVRGRGNPDSLFSSSHGAGRSLSRKEAKRLGDLEVFKMEMEGVTANVSMGTMDENPDAYKDISRVMDYQKDLVEVIQHIHPIINIKGGK